jgi:hypothetical protein
MKDEGQAKKGELLRRASIIVFILLTGGFSGTVGSGSRSAAPPARPRSATI